MRRIFINYRRLDSEGYVGRLYDHLLDFFQADQIFMDVQDITPGADFVTTLEEAVASCDVVLAVIGHYWLNIADDAGERRLDQWNDFVRIEIASALKLEKVIIPILVAGAKMPSPTTLPEDIQSLARRNAIELRHQHFRTDVERLVSAIKQAVPANESVKPRDERVANAKAEQLRAVRDDVLNATDSPLYDYRTENHFFPVIGSGYADANLIFIGEAPGYKEAQTGQPFSGPSGDIFDDMLGGIGLKRADIYMTNIVLDRAPDNRSPNKAEIAFYTPFVDRIIDIIRPAVIVPLGRFATEYLLKKLDLPEKGGKISQLHGKLIKTEIHYGEIHVVPMYHPAMALHRPSNRSMLYEDFQRLSLFT